MTSWALGDIQGCSQSFFHLLEVISFSPSQDELWLAGDLVNRGPDNLRVLRYLRDLGGSAKIVLGNHDLHLLAVNAGARKLNKKDTIQDVINAPDRESLANWLQQQPLLYHNASYCMTHAGIPPIWSVESASRYAAEVERTLKDSALAESYFFNMYGNQPTTWSERLQGWERLRIITNYLTRMRFINCDNHLNFEAKEGLDSAPAGYAPWFDYLPSEPREHELLFGHWAALEGKAGVTSIHALDTGCVWGGQLTAMSLANQERIVVDAVE